MKGSRLDKPTLSIYSFHLNLIQLVFTLITQVADAEIAGGLRALLTAR